MDHPPQKLTRDLLWKVSGLSWDNTKSGMGILKKQNALKLRAASREGFLSKLKELYVKGGQRCLG